jgi:hypothetical protein
VTGLATAARAAAVIALFALPALSLPSHAVAADRNKPATKPQPTYVDPKSDPRWKVAQSKEWQRSLCEPFRTSRPLEYKECRASRR